MLEMVGAWLLSISMPVMPCSMSSRNCCKALSCSLFASTQHSLRRRGFYRQCRSNFSIKRRSWRTRIVTGALSTSASPAGGSEPDPVGQGASGLGSTRLGRLISVRSGELLQRWNATRRNFPAKIFLLLLGFFSANALATVLGQTGDWDVIAAGILVAIIEGIGQLIYRTPAFLGDRGKAILELVNYWKIGFEFALFVDAFKVGS